MSSGIPSTNGTYLVVFIYFHPYLPKGLLEKSLLLLLAGKARV